MVLMAASVMAFGACGGGGGGEPLISGTLTGDYAGDAFTATFGFASAYQGVLIIGLGDGGIDCDSPNQNDPPPGNNAILEMPALDVGSYTSVFVHLYHNVGSFEGVGSNTGTVTITSSTADAVAGMVSYAYTDDQARNFALDGTFEIIRCAN